MPARMPITPPQRPTSFIEGYTKGRGNGPSIPGLKTVSFCFRNPDNSNEVLVMSGAEAWAKMMSPSTKNEDLQLISEDYFEAKDYDHEGNSDKAELDLSEEHGKLLLGGVLRGGALKEDVLEEGEIKESGVYGVRAILEVLHNAAEEAVSIDSSQIGGFAYEVGGYFRPIRALELLDHSTSPTPCMLLDAILRVVDADNYRLLRPTGVIISRFLLSDSLEDFFETFDLEAWYIFAYLIALLPKSSPTDEFGLWSTGLCQEYRVALRRAAKILILASELTKKWFFESLFNASISTGWVEWLQCEWDYLDRLTSNNRDTECNSSNLVGAIGDLVGKYIESLEKRIAELEAVANCVEGLAQPRGIPGASMVMFRESLPILVHDLKMRAHSLKFGWMRDEIVNISHISKFHGVAVDMPKVDMESRRQMFRGVRVCSSPMPTGTEMELEPLDVIDKELRGTSGQEICSSSFTIGDSDEEEGI